MNAHGPTSTFALDEPAADRQQRPDALERWVGVSAMAVLMAAGMFAVLL